MISFKLLLPITLIASVAGAAALVTACFQPPSSSSDDNDIEGTNSSQEKVDPLEGAYIKQGGTALHFVFKKADSDGDRDSFFGEIEEDGTMRRASGSIKVGRDNLGTNFTLTPAGSTATETVDGGEATAAADTDGGAADDPSLVDEAFSGKVYFLKIGKNNSILVRKDATGKTAHYKKARSWCRKDSDCSAKVQHVTDLTCSDDQRSCTNSRCDCAGSKAAE